MKDTQSRKYQLTINNPNEYGLSHKIIIEKLSRFNTRYYCLGDEIGENGTYHTHIYAVFNSPMRFSTLKRSFEAAHIEVAFGSSKENRDYILKDGKYKGSTKAETTVPNTFYESGELPEEANDRKNTMVLVQTMISDGASNADIIRQIPKMGFHLKDIDLIRQTLLCEKYMTENRVLNVTYVYGETGTGKTSGIYTQHTIADICRITSYSNPKALFDSYVAHTVVVFEEFHSQISMSEMLNYLDIYPIMLPARYQNKVACFDTVYITSNLPLEEQYKSIQVNEPAIWRAFLRRINTVREYTALGVFTDKETEEYLNGWRKV